jgi:hypothetical protein
MTSILWEVQTLILWFPTFLGNPDISILHSIDGGEHTLVQHVDLI